MKILNLPILGPINKRYLKGKSLVYKISSQFPIIASPCSGSLKVKESGDKLKLYINNNIIITLYDTKKSDISILKNTFKKNSIIATLNNSTKTKVKFIGLDTLEKRKREDVETPEDPQKKRQKLLDKKLYDWLLDILPDDMKKDISRDNWKVLSPNEKILEIHKLELDGDVLFLADAAAGKFKCPNSTSIYWIKNIRNKDEKILKTLKELINNVRVNLFQLSTEYGIVCDNFVKTHYITRNKEREESFVEEDEEKVYSYYIYNEPLENTLEYMLELQFKIYTDHESFVIITKQRKLLENISTTTNLLKSLVLQLCYCFYVSELWFGFYHNDPHPKNFMLTFHDPKVMVFKFNDDNIFKIKSNFTLKLIDFGVSFMNKPDEYLDMNQDERKLLNKLFNDIYPEYDEKKFSKLTYKVMYHRYVYDIHGLNMFIRGNYKKTIQMLLEKVEDLNLFPMGYNTSQINQTVKDLKNFLNLSSLLKTHEKKMIDRLKNGQYYLNMLKHEFLKELKTDQEYMTFAYDQSYTIFKFKPKPKIQKIKQESNMMFLKEFYNICNSTSTPINELLEFLCTKFK